METCTHLDEPEVDVETEVRRDRGASVVEYALLIGLIVLICIAAITILGSKTSIGLSTAAESVAGS